MGVFRVIRVWVRLDNLLLRDWHPLLMSLHMGDDGVLLPFLSRILGVGLLIVFRDLCIRYADSDTLYSMSFFNTCCQNAASLPGGILTTSIKSLRGGQ
jgi:hypothetical protein